MAYLRAAGEKYHTANVEKRDSLVDGLNKEVQEVLVFQVKI
jgi:hypothetical protein